MVAPERKSDEDAATASSIGEQLGATGTASRQPQGVHAALNASAKRNGPTSAERNGPGGAGLVDVQAASTTANDKEQRTFRASVSQACAGTSVDFKVEHMPENGIYLWNFGDGSFSNKANPEHTFSKPGRYQVMLSMSSAGGGLIQNKPSSDVIVIHEAPKAAFNVVRQEYEGHLPSVHFENRSLGGAKYHWDFGDGQTSDIAHPDHIYKKQGTYRVELTITNQIGCEDKLMKEVLVAKDYNLDAPANFSPDGDGHEDTFMPAALQKLGVKFTLSIYDLNGNLMYETKDATLPWSGKAQNRGELCPAGAYAWVVDVSESLHLAETYTGKVQLVR
jgi:gliding motility-associated-like protein